MNTDELTAPLIDCLRLIIQINRRLDRMRQLAADPEDEDIADIFALAESAQENLRDVRRDIMRIRIILESFPAPVPDSAPAPAAS